MISYDHLIHMIYDDIDMMIPYGPSYGDHIDAGPSKVHSENETDHTHKKREEQQTRGNGLDTRD